MIKYSILIPVYNVEKYLEKCLDTMVSQDYISEGYEIVLVDDGSTDSSGIICDRYSGTYEFVQVIHQSNKGLIQARRVGVEVSRGEYLVFVDSDDYVDSNFLSVIDRGISAFSPSFLMYGYIMTGCVHDHPVYLSDEAYSVYSQAEMLSLIASSDKYNGIAGKVVKADIFKNHIDEIYNYQVNVGEDKIQTAYLVKYSTKCVITRECPYYYVIRPDSVIHDKTIEDIYEVIDVYSAVREVIADTMDTIGMMQLERKKLSIKFDNMSLNGAMDAIYKFNKRKDNSVQSIRTILSQLCYDKEDFFSREVFQYSHLSLRNKFRFYLLRKRKLLCLARLDKMISILR